MLLMAWETKQTNFMLKNICKQKHSGSTQTGLTWITEMLGIIVWSFSIRSTSLLLSSVASVASGRLLTELLCELALMDILGMDWLLPTLFTVPVRPTLCSTSYNTLKPHDEGRTCNKPGQRTTSPNWPPHHLAPPLQGHYGPPGRGASSSCGTAGCLALSQNLWCAGSGQ